MKRHQRFLVALSDGDSDIDLIRYAALVGGLGIGRVFMFVHVRTPGQSAEGPRTDAEVQLHMQGLIEEHFGSPRPDVVSSCDIMVGVRVDQLIDYAVRNRCDTIMLGHRRSRSGQRALAQRIASVSPCSVWMVPEGCAVSISKVLAPIDFSDHSADSLAGAIEICRAAGLNECLAAHVYFDPSSIRYEEHVEAIRHHEQEAFVKFIDTVDRHGVEVLAKFIEGAKVGSTILYAAERYGADLLVMSTRGRSRAAAVLLGSVTSEVFRQTPIPLLAVKHGSAMMTLFDVLKEASFWERSNPKTN